MSFLLKKRNPEPRLGETLLSADLKQRIAALSDDQRRLLAHRLSKRARPAAMHGIARRDSSLVQFPLSFAQQRLWFLNELEPLNAAFNVIDINRVSGAFDVSVLEKCLNEIVRRHEILRTTFTVVDGEPFQRVLPSAAVRVDVEDLQACAVDAQPALLARQWEEELTRPWSLDQGPVIRGKVWRLGPEDQVVAVIAHHIVSDGWSKNILVRELAALFRAFSRGEPSPLPGTVHPVRRLHGLAAAVGRRRRVRIGSSRTGSSKWPAPLSCSFRPIAPRGPRRPRSACTAG